MYTQYDQASAVVPDAREHLFDLRAALDVKGWGEPLRFHLRFFSTTAKG